VEVRFARALGRSSASAFAPRFLALGRAVAASMRPDVICLHLPNLSGMLAALALGRAYVVHWHAPVLAQDISPLARTMLPAYRLLEALVLRRASRIVVTSRAMLEGCPQLSAWRGKCRVVPLGVDLPGEVANRAASAPGGGKNAPLVLSLGRFAAYKGFDRLALAAVHAPGTRFVMAGDGPLRGEVMRLVRDLGLTQRISFPGRVDDVAREALYAACDVFCLPSVSPAEAFGLVLVEAMARGRPVVAACPPGSGIAEVVVHQKTGLLVPPDDPLALAQAICALLADPGGAAAMGEAGLRRVRTLFDIRGVAGLTEQVYAQAMPV
jgi:rhamnosyl/mannosyltransferase